MRKSEWLNLANNLPHPSLYVDIEQSVKQGDVLSCSLIRKVNSDDTIEGLNIGIPILIDKLCGYADDIAFIIKDTASTLKNLFKTYHQFSKISGI